MILILTVLFQHAKNSLPDNRLTESGPDEAFELLPTKDSTRFF